MSVTRNILPPSQEIRGEVFRGLEFEGSWSRLGDLVFRVLWSAYGDKAVRGLIDKMLKHLAVLLAPMVLEMVNSALEELVQLDLNKDGVIGFGVSSDAERNNE